MKITHLTPESKPATIIVRHYDNAITQVTENIVKDFKKAEPFEIGQFRIKYNNKSFKEYKQDFLFIKT